MYNVPVDSIVYYTDDAEHNVTALVSGLTQLTENYPPVYAGDVVERYVYDVYGEAKTFNGDYSYSYGTAPFDDSLYHNTVLYKGMSRDVESGLDLSRNRVYSYNYRTWMQRDPIGYGDGTNLYQSFGSNPANESDPSGEFGWGWLAAAGGALAGAVIGGGIEVAIQLAQGKDPRDLDWGKVAGAAVNGAIVGGAIGGIVSCDPTVYLAMGAAAGFLGGGAASVTEQLINNKGTVDWGQVAQSAGWGAVGGAVGVGVGLVAQKAIPALVNGANRLLGSLPSFGGPTLVVATAGGGTRQVATAVGMSISRGLAADLAATAPSAFASFGASRGSSYAMRRVGNGGGGTNVRPRIETPHTHPDNFMPVRGSNAKVNVDTGEVFVKDGLHGNHYEVYRSRKMYDIGRRDRSVWMDGTFKEQL